MSDSTDPLDALKSNEFVTVGGATGQVRSPAAIKRDEQRAEAKQDKNISKINREWQKIAAREVVSPENMRQALATAKGTGTVSPQPQPFVQPVAQPTALPQRPPDVAPIRSDPSEPDDISTGSLTDVVLIVISGGVVSAMQGQVSVSGLTSYTP